MLKHFVTASIVLFATPAIASDMPIRIPNPPVTRSTNGGQTYQQCLNQISNMRVARNARGANKEQSARLWGRHVAQCKRQAAFASPSGQKTPRQTTGSATR